MGPQGKGRFCTRRSAPYSVRSRWGRKEAAAGPARAARRMRRGRTLLTMYKVAFAPPRAAYPVRKSTTRRTMRALPALLSALGCAAAPMARGPSEPAEVSAARAALGDFVTAVEAGRWDDAYRLLSARWRGQYTPKRLAADHAAAGPLGREAAQRV